MSDIYKYAARHQLRFPSRKGELTVERLFQLPLKSATGDDLNTVAVDINRALKGASEESFVDDGAADPRKAALTVALEIVKDVIATKQAENRAALQRLEQVEQRRKLREAIEAKKDEKLSQASIDELQKQLDALS
jgi:hypothetical protein